MEEIANSTAIPCRSGRPAADVLTGATRATEVALALAAALFLAEYVLVACLRLGYPYELEWMEGGSLTQVLHILSGQPLYDRPALDFTPTTYAPLYYYAAALLTLLFHPGFLPLRLLSFTSSLGVCGLLFLLVRRETGRRLYGLVAAGLFAATFSLGGAWFDLARVDSLFLLFILATVYLLRFGASWRAQLAAGVLLALACCTKQSALVLALPFALGSFVLWRRAAAAFALGMVATFGLAVLALNAQSHGWFLFYFFRLPRFLEVSQLTLAQFFVRDLCKPLPIVLALAILWFALRLARSGRRSALFYLCISAGMLAMTYGSRRYVGAYANNLIPACATLAVLAALALAELRAQPGRGGETEGGAARWRTGWPRVAAAALLLVQFGLLAYDPRRFLPSAADRRAGDELVRRIASLPGDVLIPEHGYLALYAGKPVHAHWMALFDVIRGDPAIGQPLVAEIREAIRSQRFSALLLATDLWFDQDIHQSYQPAGHLIEEPGRFLPVIGWKSRPEWLFVRRSRLPAQVPPDGRPNQH
jgi:dolichyl-phosphate-mannose-protein mannosyltransferase